MIVFSGKNRFGNGVDEYLMSEEIDLSFIYNSKHIKESSSFDVVEPVPQICISYNIKGTFEHITYRAHECFIRKDIAGGYIHDGLKMI